MGRSNLTKPRTHDDFDTLWIDAPGKVQLAETKPTVAQEDRVCEMLAGDSKGRYCHCLSSATPGF